MSGTATQGAQILVEFSEEAITRQIQAYVGTLITSSTITCLGAPGISASLSSSGVSIKFVPGVGDQLVLEFSITAPGRDLVFRTNPLPILRRDPAAGDMVHLNLERSAGAPEHVILATSETMDQCYGADILDSLVRPLLRQALDGLLGVPSGSPALLPLTNRVSPPTQLVGLVVTNPSGQSAFVMFVSSTSTLAPMPNAPVHITSSARVAIVIQNQIFLLAACPLIQSRFIPAGPTALNFALTLLATNPRCHNGVPAKVMGIDAITFTQLFLEIRPSESRLVFGGNYEFAPDNLHVGGGRFSVPFTISWDSAAGQLVAVPGTVDVSLILDAWIWLLAGLGVIVGALLGAAFGAVTGAIAAAVGAATTAAISALIGAIIGGVFLGILTLIVVAVFNGILAQVIRAGLTGALGMGMFPLSAVPMPVLVPMNLQPTNAGFDDFVIVGTPRLPSITINGNLRIRRREIVLGGGSREVQLSSTGDFEAVPQNFLPVQFTWSLDGIPVNGSGNVNGIHYRVNGARCSLTSQLGLTINNRLCVEVRDLNGYRTVSCRTLSAEGQTTEDFLKPELNLLFLNSPIQPIPDPRNILTVDLQTAVRTDQSFRAAISRGMDVDPGKLEGIK